jgi:hypothetical protein
MISLFAHRLMGVGYRPWDRRLMPVPAPMQLPALFLRSRAPLIETDLICKKTYACQLLPDMTALDCKPQCLLNVDEFFSDSVLKTNEIKCLQ